MEEEHCPLTEIRKETITYSSLKNMLTENEEAILDKLINKMRFQSFLRQNKFTTHEVFYLIKVVSKACQTATNDTAVLGVLQALIDCDFFPLKTYIAIEKLVNGFYEENVDSFLSSFLLIARLLLNKLELVDVVKDTLRVVKKFQQKLESNGESVRLTKKQIEAIEEECRLFEQRSEEAPTVEDFRNITTLPQSADVISSAPDPLLQPNKIDGPYDNVEHYLSVHFRLIRQDMMRTFRESISNFKKDTNAQNLKSGILFRDINIVYPPEYTIHGLAHTIHFKTKIPINWARSKLLLPGAIVFLSCDNFKSVICATVDSHNMKDGHSSQCTIKVLFVDRICTLEPNKLYCMIETNAYFESYRHVMEAYKQFNASNLPLQNYIVNLDPSDPNPDHLKALKFCLHEKCKGPPKNFDEECKCKAFDVLDTNQWPSAKEMGLDENQRCAFQLAVTQKLSIIQGPPGTGKTFIGIKIVKALLQNCDKKPIVICCVTNHALDQFLCHLMKPGNDIKKIVRIGQQSKNPGIKPYTLSNMLQAVTVSRQNSYTTNTVPEQFKQALEHACLLVPDIIDTSVTYLPDDKLDQLKSVCKTINCLSRCYSLSKDEYFNETALNDILPSSFREHLSPSSSKSIGMLPRHFKKWLSIETNTNPYETCESYWKTNRRNGPNPNNIIEEDEDTLSKFAETSQIWAIPLHVRFQLFHKWRKQCLAVIEKDISENTEWYFKHLTVTTREIPYNQDSISLLSNADIIGMTMTGAAKYRAIIQASNPTIMVVEEAAEALECHLISSMVCSIKQLILIGDHKQLRPLTCDHDLAVNYNLNISLFERLYNNGMPSCTINTQFRMRPCIAELLVPEIYPKLESHSSVENFEDIKGISKNLFFFKHEKDEDANSSSTSSSNRFEVVFIRGLVMYLIQLGYVESQITILSMYAAQLALISDSLRKNYPNLEVKTVDSYQGEENDIVIISFVRSNLSNTIGFLKEDNRSCVALSRARKGLYCIGNFTMIASRNEFWSAVMQKLEEAGRTGYLFPLQCQIHKDPLPVSTVEEIEAVLSNGCKKPCGFQLPCNHLCPRMCHSNDTEHIKLKCMEPCKRVSMPDPSEPDAPPIQCKRRCSERCKIKKKIRLHCGHRVSVDVNFIPGQGLPKCQHELNKLLTCGHFDLVPCSVNPEKHICPALVKVKLVCGHSKLVPCKFQTALTGVSCSELTQHVAMCGHQVEVPCYMNPEDDILVEYCKESCGALLDCGHNCIGPCRNCFNTKIHPLCSYTCDLMLQCGHNCNGVCGVPCFPCKQECELRCSHSACVNPCMKPCVNCKKKCARSCSHQECTNQCFMICNVQPCSRPCEKILNCSHRCIGLCGDPCPSLCRVCNRDALPETATDADFYVLLEDCKHIVEVNTLTAHVEEQIIVLEWPTCPKCSIAIWKSHRFSDHLKKLKNIILGNSDLQQEIDNVYFLFRTMFGINEPTWRFIDVHNRINYLLERKDRTYMLLRTLKECISCLNDLIQIEKHLPEEPQVENDLQSLIMWITNHLELASYQQLKELKEKINLLKKAC